MLAELIEKVAGSEVKSYRFYPRPSYAGPERCLRQLVYMARGVQGKKISDRLVLALDDSSWHEELTLNWLRKTHLKIHSEQLKIECGIVPFKNKEVVIKGHIDAIVTDPLNKDYLLEHKAINHFSFQRYLEKDFPLDYFTQCAMYITGLQKLNPSINEGFLLMKNKNTCHYLEFYFEYDSKNDLFIVKEIKGSNGYCREGKTFENLYSNAIERFRIVDFYTQNIDFLPERQYTLQDWQCSYCQYNDICYEDYDKNLQKEGIVQKEEESKELKQLLETYISLLTEYQTKKDIEKELKDIKKEIIKFLTNKKLQSLKCDNFVVELEVKAKNTTASVPSFSEKLNIFKLGA